MTKNCHFACLAPPPPLGDLGATYAVHRRLIGKQVVDFFMSDNFFSLRYVPLMVVSGASEHAIQSYANNNELLKSNGRVPKSSCVCLLLPILTRKQAAHVP